MGGEGGGFFTFALAAVGAIVGAAVFAPAVGAVAASGLFGTTTMLGSVAVGAAAGMVAGTMVGGLMGSDQKVPDTQMPSFSTINYKDGLDTVSEAAVEAPTYEEAAATAQRKLDAEQKGVGYADTILTATTDMGKANTKKQALLGG